MNEIKITERGWAGHFICASSCRFRRNTLIESGDTQIVVSTVGQYANPLNGKIDEIGYNRWYETMAFEAKEQDGYIEADVTKELYFDSEAGIYGETWDEVIKKYHLVDNCANDMHDKVVAEFVDRIKKGNLIWEQEYKKPKKRDYDPDIPNVIAYNMNLVDRNDDK